MSLGTGLTRRPDLVVIGIILGSGGLSDVTGCSSTTVARGMSETGFAGTLTEFRQPLQVQSHLEMSGILVQLGHIQRT